MTSLPKIEKGAIRCTGMASPRLSGIGHTDRAVNFWRPAALAIGPLTALQIELVGSQLRVAHINLHATTC